MNKFEDNNGEMFRKLFDQMKADDSVIKAQINDQRLLRLAEYDVTHGYMRMKVTPEELQSRFFELKGLVIKGEASLKALEDDVYKRWGVCEETREEAVLKELETGNKITPIGFNLNDMPVAKMSEKSKRNH